jgi:IPT/TIG domain
MGLMMHRPIPNGGESEVEAMKHVGRHSGRRASVRVLVSLVGVTLIVGLTAVPASANTITSFTPKCGVVGTSVTITGSGFTGLIDVKFNGTSSTNEAFVSDSTVTASVPNLATTGPIVVDATNPDTPSATDFVVATAAAPTITSFTPTVGPIGTVVTITGTNFCGTTAVKFNTTTATAVTVNSATSITATVPTGATTGKISVTNTVSTATSATDFVVVGTPTISSFTPAFGPVGTSVKITGTNFSGPGFTTTSVKFNNVTASFVVNSATQITATVPTGATTGKISVTTPGGTATSATNFTVSTVHSRSVTLSLKRHLVAKGVVSVGDGFTACVASVPVKIQRRVSGSWKAVGSTTTTSTGSYSKKLKDKTGKYRAKAPKVTLNAGVDICKGAKSSARTHKH